MVRHCVAAGCNNSIVSLDLVYFGFQKIHNYIKVGKNLFDEQEAAGKVQQSTMEFVDVTLKNTVLRYRCITHTLALYS